MKQMKHMKRTELADQRTANRKVSFQNSRDLSGARTLPGQRRKLEGNG